jgi:F-type H+-transporting ATPase subunit delta
MTTFRGASADAVAVLTGELESVSGSSLATVGRDLFGVASTLRAEGALRRSLTDGSIPAGAKAGLARDVFGGKVDQATLTLLESAVAQRWTAARDLADALEQLGVVAVVKAAGNDSGRVSDELFALAQAIKDNDDLRDALADPVRSIADKRGLLGTILAGKVHEATLVLAEQSVTGSFRTVSGALTEYQRIAADAFGQAVATVRVARPLPDEMLRRLTGLLSEQYGRQIHVNLLVDPALIGGVRIEIGDDVIDGAVSSRLDEARRRLVG